MAKRDESPHLQLHPLNPLPTWFHKWAEWSVSVPSTTLPYLSVTLSCSNSNKDPNDLSSTGWRCFLYMVNSASSTTSLTFTERKAGRLTSNTPSLNVPLLSRQKSTRPCAYCRCVIEFHTLGEALAWCFCNSAVRQETVTDRKFRRAFSSPSL